MMSDAMAECAADRFRALADSTRIRILLRLREGERNVSTLAAELDIRQPSISKHLSILRQAGLVAVRHDGAQSLFSIKDATIFDMCDIVCASVRRHHEEMTDLLGLSASSKASRRKQIRH